MPPYRARLSGMFGSGVQMPPQRQPIVDVGSIIDAISGAKNSAVQREWLKADRQRQQVQDQRAEEDRQRGIAAEQAQAARQTRLDSEQSADRAHNRQMSLAKAISEGYQPAAPRPVASVSSAGLPGMGGISVPVPGHYDPTQSASYKFEGFKHLRDRAEKEADTQRLFGQQEKIARIRSSQRQPTGQISEDDRLRAISTMALQLMKPTKGGLGGRETVPGMETNAAFKEAERRVNLAVSAARGTQAPATAAAGPSAAQQQVQTLAAEVVDKIRRGEVTLQDAQTADYPAPVIEAIQRALLAGPRSPTPRGPAVRAP